MLFNSFEFAVFFPTVALLHFALPHRLRWMLLLLASCLFYMYAVPIYILILAFTVMVDYVAGILIENAEGKRRKQYLGLSIVANVGVLALFKYADFASETVATVAAAAGWRYVPPHLGLVLPVGLSFHTFQAMSYTIEVYRGRQRAERHLGIYALYVMYFPQLVAGPIERPQNLLPQLHVEQRPDAARIADGLRRIAFGLFKKVVIADRLAASVSAVYADPARHDGPALVLATVFFAFQIYCDFSGYSDMAVGASRVLGIDLMENFNAPYLSRSIREFWLRWHISLSTWFRDYVYLPLGGNRSGEARTAANLAVVFLLSGLWHGANWTFVLWGAFHAACIIAARLLAQARARVAPTAGSIRSASATVGTFVLVCLGWVLFRATSVADAAEVYRGFARGWGRLFGPEGTTALVTSLAVAPPELALAALFIVLLITIERGCGELHPMAVLSRQPAAVRWPGYYALVIFIVVFGVFDDSPFIYFQF